MNTYLWLIFICIAVTSFLPLVRLDLFSVSPRYQFFKYLSIGVFLWSIIIFLGFVIEDSLMLYYLLLLKYPLIYFVSAVTMLAFFRYFNIKLPKILYIFLSVFLFVEILMALTNQFHLLFLEVPYSVTVTSEDILSADGGPFFILHTIICYLLLIIAVFLMIRKMYVSMKQDHDRFPFILIVIGILIGITVNFIHVFVVQFNIDPTYIMYVVFLSILYYTFYIRDVSLILKMGNHQFILNNLREMFLIVNHRDEVVSASTSFLERFSIKLDVNTSLDDVMKKIKENAIVYSSSKEIVFQENKSFIHMKVKDINLPYLIDSGHMILFYDETKIQNYIRDMDYVMNHDLMTGLYNRNYLESLRSSFQYENDFGCIIFDLDGLKLFNDYLGHKAGDALLQRFASILKDLSMVDQEITTIRMGGDEFLLIFKHKDQKKLDQMLAKIIDSANAHHPIDKIEFSYGYHIARQGENLSEVLSLADKHMYEMKASRSGEKQALEMMLQKHRSRKID